MKKPPKNVSASVRARLLRLARERSEDFQLLLARYANERLLYRLASSPHSERFILKGATLFMLWTGKAHRATRDVDLLGFGDPTPEHLRRVFAEVLALDVGDDGVSFAGNSLDVGPIREDQEYGGIRVVTFAEIDSARVRIQVDVGYGDAVTPAPVIAEVPALLDFPAPRLRAYPRETVVAEKLEAMVQLGQANSRMKDFYDLVVLSRMFEFDGALLASAIRATFERRGTPLPTALPVALTSAFADDPAKRMQWSAFARKSGADDVEDLAVTVATITRFIVPPLRAAEGGVSWTSRWPAGGPWTPA